MFHPSVKHEFTKERPSGGEPRENINNYWFKLVCDLGLCALWDRLPPRGEFAKKKMARRNREPKTEPLVFSFPCFFVNKRRKHCPFCSARFLLERVMCFVTFGKQSFTI